MPSRNVIKQYAPESYYHVYARGASKQKIFQEQSDYTYFIGLFERYLSNKEQRSKTGQLYPNFNKNIELIAYCLMTNHFHMLIYQENSSDISGFMRSIMTSYSRYFNLKYKRSGALFESRYKASRVDNDSYLQHITRYIHLNPKNWDPYRHSSYRFYKNGGEPIWLKPDKIIQMFSSAEEYTDFVADYEEMKEMFVEIKYQLADQ